jgi:hypothetical protein
MPSRSISPQERQLAGPVYDLVETEPSETVFDHGLRCFKGIALAPIGAGEPPAQLDRWGERRLVGHPIQADRTDEAGFTGDLNRPLAKAMLVAGAINPTLTIAVLRDRSFTTRCVRDAATRKKKRRRLTNGTIPSKGPRSTARDSTRRPLMTGGKGAVAHSNRLRKRRVEYAGARWCLRTG